MSRVLRNNLTVRVSLTGGLGNQLFQLAFALNYVEDNEVILETALGRPRLNSHKLPELMSFELPSQVTLSKKKRANGLSMKIAGFLLRQGAEKRKIDRLVFFTRITKSLAAVILSITFRKPVKPLIGQGVGFFQANTNQPRNLLLGYFQSYRWASNPVVYEKLQRLKIQENSEAILKYRELAMIEKPLVVHFRLGDYKNEDLFGIPPYSYYLEAIMICWSTGKYQSIWAFSDEEVLARELYGDVFPCEVRWITEFSDSAAFTLDVMRLGHGYVIANSTFSWWAAFLSHHRNCQVVSPSPWFRGLEAPKELIPSNWVVLEYEK